MGRSPPCGRRARPTPGFIATYGEGISVLAWDHTHSIRLETVDAQGRVADTGFTWRQPPKEN
jgi:hypothetical protein